MHQTRQFTKRRPQSPSIYQQQAVDTLQVGINKPALPRSGLAIQSNAPLHVSHRSSPVIHHQNTETHEHHHEHDYKTHSTTTVINPYAPVNHNHQAHDEGHNHNHEAHQHDHMGHDHHNHHDGHEHHDHHEHNHAHDTHQHSGHNHHGHDHHNHDHKGHDHSGHSHNFPQVYTQPLPSYSSIFASLTPSQKALFTYFFGHFAIGIIVWWLGAARESLSIVGFSYLVLFDAFGTLNNVVSSVLHLNPIFTATSTKRPFGVKRFEVVFALANAIFLLFGTMYTTKESLEHLLLENHHSVDHHSKSSFPFGLLFMLLVAIGASFGSNTGLRNHENLVNLRNKSSQMQSEYSYTDIKSVGGNPLDSLKRNIYSLSIISTGSIVFLLSLFNITSPTLDKFLAFGESALMLYLGGPTAAALAKVLLQTMPDSIVSKVDYNIRQVQQNQNILSVDKVHFWQNSYGKCIGTAEVFAKPEANEDDVLDATFDILENLVKDNDGELTISVTKRE